MEASVMIFLFNSVVKEELHIVLSGSAPFKYLQILPDRLKHTYI